MGSEVVEWQSGGESSDGVTEWSGGVVWWCGGVAENRVMEWWSDGVKWWSDGMEWWSGRVISGSVVKSGVVKWRSPPY